MSEQQFARVAVLGTGTMGAGIAQVCAAAGSTVAMTDVSQERLDLAQAGIAKFLDKGIEKGKTTEGQKQAVLGALAPTTDLAAAVKDADLVVEAVPEDIELKRGLFERVVAASRDDCVLATNTSSLSLGKIFDGIAPFGRCLGMHFFNPPPIMPLLEVVRLDGTDAAVVERVLAYGRALGKEPILVRDSPGFASSRLGVVLGLEAIRMVEEGVASPEDIDKAMTLGYRHPMGPLRLTDLVGLDVRLAIADYLRKELDQPGFEAPQLMRDMVAEGKLGKKTGQGFYPW